MLSAPCISSAVSPTIAKSGTYQNSSFGTTIAAGFDTSSATGLKHFRINVPSAAASLGLSSVHSVQQYPGGSRQQKLSSSEDQFEKYYKQFSNMAAMTRFRLPAQQKMAPPKVNKTLSKPSSALITTTVSPSKFFRPGTDSVDFDEYIGKSLPVISQLPKQASENQTMTKSAVSTVSSAEVDLAKQKKKRQSLEYTGERRKRDSTEPQKDNSSEQKPGANMAKMKQQSPVCAGVKRKSHSAESPAEADSSQKTECRFADKFMESLSVGGFFDNAEADGLENKSSADSHALTKESAVCTVCYLTVYS